MTDQLFYETLTTCKRAYAMGIEDYFSPRRVKREFQGALPKRRQGIARLLERAKKLHPDRCWNLYGPERALVIAAYDLGLRSEHAEQERKRGEQA